MEKIKNKLKKAWEWVKSLFGFAPTVNETPNEPAERILEPQVETKPISKSSTKPRKRTRQNARE